MTTYVNGRIGTSDDTTATTTMAMTTYVNGRIVIAIVVIAVDAAYRFTYFSAGVNNLLSPAD